VRELPRGAGERRLLREVLARLPGGRAYLSISPGAWRAATRPPRADKARFLDEALVEVERCELCAAALVSDGDCPRCRLSFRDGVRRPLASSAR
jgi:hypothetical protein